MIIKRMRLTAHLSLGHVVQANARFSKWFHRDRRTIITLIMVLRPFDTTLPMCRTLSSVRAGNCNVLSWDDGVRQTVYRRGPASHITRWYQEQDRVLYSLS